MAKTQLESVSSKNVLISTDRKSNILHSTPHFSPATNHDQ